MKAIEVSAGIYRLTTDVQDILFEEMWYLPNGVTLNSYLVKGDRLAIIDGFCGWDGIPEKLFEQLAELDVTIEQLDYIVINHMEPDHSGWLEKIVELKPDVEIICSKMASDLLEGFFGITENVRIAKAGDSVDLGQGKTLTFFPQPNVHWPDTMFTLETSSKTLFSCDMFGTYGTCGDNHFDDELSPADYECFHDDAIRYFSNVLVTYSSAVEKAIAKTKELAPKIIAPGHGPVWRKEPEKIIDIYSEIVSWNTVEARDEVLILWGSMYGMTAKAVQHIENLFTEQNRAFTSLQVPETPIGTIISHALRSKYIIIAAPTYEAHLFPPMASTLQELFHKKIAHKKAVYIGSYGWAAAAHKELIKIAENAKAKWEFLDPFVFKGSPSDDDLVKIKALMAELK